MPPNPLDRPGDQPVVSGFSADPEPGVQFLEYGLCQIAALQLGASLFVTSHEHWATYETDSIFHPVAVVMSYQLKCLVKQLGDDLLFSPLFLVHQGIDTAELHIF